MQLPFRSIHGIGAVTRLLTYSISEWTESPSDYWENLLRLQLPQSASRDNSLELAWDTVGCSLFCTQPTCSFSRGIVPSQMGLEVILAEAVKHYINRCTQYTVSSSVKTTAMFKHSVDTMKKPFPAVDYSTTLGIEGLTKGYPNITLVMKDYRSSSLQNRISVCGVKQTLTTVEKYSKNISLCLSNSTTESYTSIVYVVDLRIDTRQCVFLANNKNNTPTLPTLHNTTLPNASTPTTNPNPLRFHYTTLKNPTKTTTGGRYRMASLMVGGFELLS